VPGQRRLAISWLPKSWVPNHDGLVKTAADNVLSIGAPRHRGDAVFVIVGTWINRNQVQKLRKKLTCPSARSLGTRKRTFWNLLHLDHFRAYFYQQKVSLSSSLYSQVFNSTKEKCFFCYFPVVFIKKTHMYPSTRTDKKELTKIKRKLTCTCAPSPATRKSKFWVFYISIFSECIHQKMLRFRVACLVDTHTGTYNLYYLFVAYWLKKAYGGESPVRVDSHWQKIN